MVYYWLGDASDTTATVVVRSDTAGTVTITGVTATGVSVNPAVEYGINKITVTGLTADTRYPFTLLLDGVTVASGTLRTLPAAGSFNIGWGSCVGQLSLHAWGFQAVLDHDIRAMFGLGDTPYCDEAVLSNTVDTVAQRRWSLGAAANGSYSDWATGRIAYDKMYDNFHQIPGISYVLERVPFYRMADDHEYGDDWDWTWTNTKNNVTGKGFVLGGAPLLSQADADTCGLYANTAFDSWAKGNPAPASGLAGWKPSACADSVANHPPRFFTKMVAPYAQVFFVSGFEHRDPWPKTDTFKTVCINRAENAALGYTYSDPAGAALAKTMLGPNVLDRLLTELKASTATFKIIMSGPMPTVMNANLNGGLGPNNAWEQWQTEMDYIRAFIKKYVTGVIWLTGDAHIPSVINDRVLDYCCVNSSPLSQINYIGSSGARFYNAGYSQGCIYRAEGMDSSTAPGSKKNAYGILGITPDYLKPQIYDENGDLLWEGYLLPGKNVLQMSLTETSGEWA